MGILDEAKSMEDMTDSYEEYHIKCLLLGQSGSGKTTLAASLPGKKLLLDLDQKKASVQGFSNIKAIDFVEESSKVPIAWTKLESIKFELWNMVKQGTFPYRAIIIDSLTSMGRFSMNEVLKQWPAGAGWNKTPGKPHWSPQMKYMEDFVLGMIPLPCHIIFTGHLDMFEDKLRETTIWLPKVGGKKRTEYPGWFNEVYYTSRKPSEKGTQYFIHTTSHESIDFLSSSLNLLEKYWDSPINVTYPGNPNTSWGFRYLLERRFGSAALIEGEKEVTVTT